MLKRVSLLSLSLIVITPLQFYAMEEVAAPLVATVANQRDKRNSMLRSRSVPVMQASESIVALRTYMRNEVTKQEQAEKDAEELQLRTNNRFHSATGLDTDKKPLKSYDEHKVTKSFEKAQQLHKEGADIKWGYPLVNLLVSFKMRQEYYSNYSGDTWNRRQVSSGYSPAKDPAVFGKGHAFLAWLVDKGADVNKAWPQDDASRFVHYEDSYLNQAGFVSIQGMEKQY